jgi:NAD(P)-dependent dehydrogenase (short-subunit alcohol dehydrogenase family)
MNELSILEAVMTALKGASVFVTGGSRGIGKAMVEELFVRGAGKVYATARDPRTVTHPDAVPVALEVTDPASVAAAAAQAQDVTVLINNAGGAVRASFLDDSPVEDVSREATFFGASLLDSPVEEVRRDFETNFYGPLLLTRAFVPIIERNGGGHIFTMHSVLSWVADGGAYSASKAALWSQTNSLRLELQPRGISVTGLHAGYVNTDLTADRDAAKSDPRTIAALALDGIETGAYEVLGDDITRQVKTLLAGDLAGLYPRLAK